MTSYLRQHELKGFEARLLPMLVATIEQRGLAVPPRAPRRSHMRRRLAGAALATAVLFATATVVTGRDTIEVDANKALSDPDEVVQDLRDAGIEAQILVVPVPRPMAGTWWHLYFAPRTDVDAVTWAKLKAQVGVGVAQLPEKFRDSGRGVFHREVLELPRNLPGAITLLAGRARQQGEQEAWMDNELAPGGAFWCLHLERMEPEQAGQVLEGMGYQLSWSYNTFHTPGGESRTVSEPPADSALISAWFSSPEVIMLPLALANESEPLRVGAGTPTSDAQTPGWAPRCAESS